MPDMIVKSAVSELNVGFFGNQEEKYNISGKNTGIKFRFSADVGYFTPKSPFRQQKSNKLLPKIIIYTQKANIDTIRHNKKPIFVENVGFISQSPAKSQQPAKRRFNERCPAPSGGMIHSVHYTTQIHIYPYRRSNVRQKIETAK